MNTKWIIRSANTKNIDGLNNVVFSVTYSVIASFDDVGFMIDQLETIELPSPNIDNFIPIEQVDKQKVLDWVKNQLGSEGINRINQDLNDKYIMNKNTNAGIKNEETVFFD